jgi:hypothetical protein
VSAEPQSEELIAAGAHLAAPAAVLRIDIHLIAMT